MLSLAQQLIIVLSVCFISCSSSEPEDEEGDIAAIDETLPGESLDDTTETDSSSFDSGSESYEDPIATSVPDVSTVTVHFAFDRSDIQPKDEPNLEDLARTASTAPNMTLLVTGYADERGSMPYNDALGMRRAESVKQYLIMNGVMDSQITTMSLGSKPEGLVIPNATTPDEHAQNRRVVIEGNGAAPATTDSFSEPSSMDSFSEPSSTDSFSEPSSTDSFSEPSSTDSFDSPVDSTMDEGAEMEPLY